MFTYPFLLWGLFFALIPVLIHLINLLRHRPVEWGAMEFLLTAYKKHRTRVRMKEFILLCMRVMLIVFLVLMLAEPVIRQMLPGSAKTHHIVVLDDSFSMTDRVGETSIFENAKNSIQKLIDELAQQDGLHNFTLIRTSQSCENARHADIHEQRIGRNFRETFSLTGLAPSQTSGYLDEALAYVSELVPEEKSIENKILYIFSDFRTNDWSENPSLSSRFSSLVRDGFRLHFVDCVSDEHPNLAVSNLNAEEGIQVAGVPILMSIRVANFGRIVAKNVVLHPILVSMPPVSVSEIASNNSVTQTLPTVTIPEIPAGESVTVSFSVTCPQPGNYSVRVSLPPDAILDDNQSVATLSIKAFESVLIIDNSLDASTSLFLRTALSPGEHVQTGIVPQVEKARFLSTNDLSAFHSIYLLDIATLDPQAVTALETYLKNGGGVCVFVGPHTDPLMAQKWFRDGQGFFPIVLEQTEELPPYYASPDIRVAPHPIFRIFSDGTSTQFNSIHIERYYTLDDVTLENIIPLQDETAIYQAKKYRDQQEKTKSTQDSPPTLGNGDVRVIAALRNNAPLVVERKYGRGKVIVFLTTADRTWTDWPIGNPSQPNPFAQGSYVVMMLQLQSYLTPKSSDSWTVGDTFSLVFPADKYDGNVTFFNPDLSVWEHTLAVSRPDGMYEAKTSPISVSGVFCASLKTTASLNESRLFAVNVDASEGNTRKIARDQLVEEMGKTPFDWVPLDSFRFAHDDTTHSVLSDWILITVLFLLVFEMILAASASYHLVGIKTAKNVGKMGGKK